MMGRVPTFLNLAVAAFLATVSPLRAEDALMPLFDQLAQPGNENWESVEHQIWVEMSRSGSAALDLLLSRGREALEADDPDTALDHFNALIDHAPDFAEGYNARAVVFFKAEMYGPALQDLRMALTLEPRHFAALSGMGQIYEDMGDDVRALALYRAARAIHPHRSDLKAAVERLEPRVDGTAL